MQQEIVYSTESNTIDLNPHLPLMEQYSVLLDNYGLTYKTTEYYLEIGEPGWVQGWIIDISAIPVEMQKLLETTLPFLITEKVPFKIARDAKIARAILGGDLGYILLGKFMAIYPPNERRALDIALNLIKVTKIFKGPDILTDRCLGNVVYTRYGAVNPIIGINESGLEENYIHDSQGKLIKDPYSIPFQLLEGIKWPFQTIVSSKHPKKETVLQDKYKPMYVLKEDAKGSVRKGLYLEKLWRIKWCVIKEAKRNMLGDSMGRDITDRLLWQCELHKDLEGVVPLPKVYDLFQENDDTYLVMEYINGKSLTNVITETFNDLLWPQLSLTKRSTLIGYVLQILTIIDRMHQKQYIHRDITPGNFLINKSGEIWMIDLELSYSESLRKPFPPYRLGTPGFMSPEQQETLTPTRQQDIYAIGALMIFMFTGLLPDKFSLQDLSALNEQLNFFIPDVNLVNLISYCLDDIPSRRPTISLIRAQIEKFWEVQDFSHYSQQVVPAILSPDHKRLNLVITNALRGLCDPALLSSDQLWPSRKRDETTLAYYQNSAMKVYPDFHQGVSGIMWVLARAHKSGFSTEPCMDAYTNSLEFIETSLSEQLATMPAGLYFGTSGVAMALAEGLSAGLIMQSDDAIVKIQSFLQNENIQGNGIAKGLAGQGIALLHTAKLIDSPFTQQLIHQKVEQLLLMQQKDGSWLTKMGTIEKQGTHTGLSYGMAGIIWFLLSYTQQYKNDLEVTASVIRGLNWLISQSYKKHGHTRWHTHTSTKASSPDIQNGCLGIVISLIKAYEVLGNPEFRFLAEDCLRGYSFKPVSGDITQATGLSGIGELYIEAGTTFNSREWLDRADSIMDFILHHFRQQNNGSCFWMTDSSTPFQTAGLMEGSSGIIQFLLRKYDSKSLGNPLFLI
jgi:serine/threonine protein kinase